MAVDQKDIKATYPLLAYNYRVTVLLGGSSYALTGVEGEAVSTISCSEVSGLNMEVETVTYKHGFSFLTGTHIIPAQKKEVRLTIKKGVTINSKYFSDWIKLVYPITEGLPEKMIRKRDLLIDLCDENGEPVVRWVVAGAMPIKLEAPTFDVNTNEVAFEQMDFIAHHLKVEYLNT